ncbi:unnamed protein product, partial [Prorocentrum cordatum]
LLRSPPLGEGSGARVARGSFSECAGGVERKRCSGCPAGGGRRVRALAGDGHRRAAMRGAAARVRARGRGERAGARGRVPAFGGGSLQRGWEREPGEGGREQAKRLWGRLRVGRPDASPKPSGAEPVFGSIVSPDRRRQGCTLAPASTLPQHSGTLKKSVPSQGRFHEKQATDSTETACTVNPHILREGSESVTKNPYRSLLVLRRCVLKQHCLARERHPERSLPAPMEHCHFASGARQLWRGAPTRNETRIERGRRRRVMKRRSSKRRDRRRQAHTFGRRKRRVSRETTWRPCAAAYAGRPSGTLHWKRGHLSEPLRGEDDPDFFRGSLGAGMKRGKEARPAGRVLRGPLWPGRRRARREH